MTSSDWQVQVHPETGSPEEPLHFPDFVQILTFIKAFRLRKSNDTLMVHVPDTATLEEHRALQDNGAVPESLPN